MANRRQYRTVTIDQSKIDKVDIIHIHNKINGKIVRAQVLKRGPLFIRVVPEGSMDPLLLTRQSVNHRYSYTGTNLLLETNGERVYE
jgi:hypothetical protein